MTDINAVTRTINDLAARLELAWNQHDARAFAATFAEDADFTNVFGVALHGRAAIERSHANIFATMFKDSAITATVSHIRVIRPDVATVDLHWDMTGARDVRGNASPDRRGLMNLVATETAGIWSFAVFHNQDLPPPERVKEIAELLNR